MSLFDDAAAFMKSRPMSDKADSSHDELVLKLQAEFENASRPEIEKALDKLAERDGIPSDFKELLKKIRIWLED